MYTILRRERWIPYAFLLPALALLLIFNVYPTLATVSESMHINALSRTLPHKFVGFQNYERIFNDPIFWKSLQVTLAFNLIVNPVQIALALLMAMLANQRVRGIAIFRSVFLLPVAISLSVTAVVWGLMLDRNGGLVNGILVSLGLPAQPFLSSAGQALACIILISSWKGVPYWMLFFLAGLQGIPQSLVEAAEIDGANRWQVFTRITLPLLRRVIIFVLVADSAINFALFIPVFLLTSGGPQLSTNLIMYETYRRGFVYGDLGSSSAMLTVMLVVVGVVISTQFFLLRERN
jgi:ABC-type sugar transport system permease subunit